MIKTLTLLVAVSALGANGQSYCTTDTGCPGGSFASQCNQCYMDSSNPGNLVCNCPVNPGYDGTPWLTSSIQNAFACNGCISNVAGNLKCVLPPSASVNGYQSSCTQCSMSNGILSCATCNGYQNTFSMANACACTSGVAAPMINNGQLYCASSTPSPTFPTASPTFPTSSPTFPTASPQSAGNLCVPSAAEGNYWAAFTTEAAPQKMCSQFTTTQGCSHQNWCCFQYSVGSTTSGICVNPNGVPECLAFSTPQSCPSPYCTWTSYGGGMCQRVCPGNVRTMCN